MAFSPTHHRYQILNAGTFYRNPGIAQTEDSIGRLSWPTDRANDVSECFIGKELLFLPLVKIYGCSQVGKQCDNKNQEDILIRSRESAREVPGEEWKE